MIVEQGQNNPANAPNEDYDQPQSVLLVEPDSDLRRVIAASLENRGWHVLQASSQQSARRLMAHARPEVLITELSAAADSQADNANLIDVFRQRAPEEHYVLVTTSHRPPRAWREANQPDGVVYKPFDVRHLCRRVQTLAEQS
jgi:CheY-like chemotaxis protein